ncbi:hypothetical protein Q8F89_29130, partial [Klebsiella pneumoniae]|uniref:hypothetical protein n=1 Tax=Klebsiella pneumoniae TaxID=573 RepID=UPI0027311F30
AAERTTKHRYSPSWELNSLALSGFRPPLTTNPLLNRLIHTKFFIVKYLILSSFMPDISKLWQ